MRWQQPSRAGHGGQAGCSLTVRALPLACAAAAAAGQAPHPQPLQVHLLLSQHCTGCQDSVRAVSEQCQTEWKNWLRTVAMEPPGAFWPGVGHWEHPQLPAPLASSTHLRPQTLRLPPPPPALQASRLPRCTALLPAPGSGSRWPLAPPLLPAGRPQQLQGGG